MRKMIQLSVMILLSHALLAGCTTKKLESLVTKAHDEVLIYDLPYDLTYLKVVEAVQKNTDWNLAETEKERGMVRVFHAGYKFLDQDQRRITFWIKRVNREQTSVEIDSADQRVPGGAQLLKQIGAELSVL